MSAVCVYICVCGANDGLIHIMKMNQFYVFVFHIFSHPVDYLFTYLAILIDICSL